jgi:hypothetical protein
MNAAATTAAVSPDAPRTTYHGLASALIDGAQAFAYGRRGPGQGKPYRVSQTAQTRLGGFGPVSEHDTRAQAMLVWTAYVGRCRLAGRVVTERRVGETLEAWDARHEVERAARKGLRAV